MNILNERVAPKRDEHWRAFDKEWFARHQVWLLFGLNTPGLATIVRGLLRIRMSDVGCPWGTAIVAIAPDHYTVCLPDGQLRTDFRTHWKYSKRCYYAWKPLWWLLHGWDAVFADRWAPALSYGFATLTAYPDAHVESATVDGYVTRENLDETFTTLRNGAGNASGDADTSALFCGVTSSTTLNQFATIVRSIFLFDTSGIDDLSTVTAAVLSLAGTSQADTFTVPAAPDIDIYASTPASNTALANADYAQIGTVSQTGSPITYAGFNTSGYNDFTFDATGRGNVSKTSISKFGARNANYDVANSAPTWSSGKVARFVGSFADVTGTTSDPKLVVTYASSASAFAGRSMTTLGYT